MDETKDDPQRKDDQGRFASGAEGEGSKDTSTPFSPAEDDDTPVGDTDQHSKADHDHDPAEDIKPGNAATD